MIKQECIGIPDMILLLMIFCFKKIKIKAEIVLSPGGAYFFYATFLKFVFTEAPAQFLQETKRFARGLLKALGLTGDHQKCFRKFLNFFFYFLFKVFR